MVLVGFAANLESCRSPSLQLSLAKIEKQRKPKRNSYKQRRGDRKPQSLHFEAPAFVANKTNHSYSGNKNIHAQESTDAICEKLVEEEAHVQPVLDHPGDELRIRKSNSEKAKKQVEHLSIHAAPLDRDPGNSTRF